MQTKTKVTDDANVRTDKTPDMSKNSEDTAYDNNAVRNKCINVKSAQVWNCINAENTNHSCDYSYCGECFEMIMESEAPKRKRSKGSMNHNQCDHTKRVLFKEADILYVVGTYADKIRCDGGVLPTHCKGCKKRYV